MKISYPCPLILEKETARNLMEANADNYDGVVKEVRFLKTAEELEGIAL